MLFLDLVNEAIDRLKKDRNDETIRDRVKSLVNSQYQFVCHASPWKQLEKYQEIMVEPIFSTGKASVTNGSYTVSLTSTPPAGSAGRYFTIDKGTNSYRIRRVDGNDLVLYSPVAEDSESNLDFKITKIHYTLNSNVRQITRFGNASDYNKNYLQDSIGGRSPRIAANLIDSGFIQENPYREAGTDEFVSDYSTGTVSITKDSNIITGTDTAWLGNLSEGGNLEINSSRFYIKRVESNTRIVSLNYATQTSSGSYIGREDNPRQIELLTTIPSGGRKLIIPIRYISLVYPMLNENFDQTEVNDTFRECILAFVEARFQADSNDPKANSNLLLSRAGAYLEGLKARKDLVVAPFRQFAPMIPRISGR